MFSFLAKTAEEAHICGIPSQTAGIYRKYKCPLKGISMKRSQ
jgi:hypothetical protein